MQCSIRFFRKSQTIGERGSIKVRSDLANDLRLHRDDKLAIPFYKSTLIFKDDLWLSNTCCKEGICVGDTTTDNFGSFPGGFSALILRRRRKGRNGRRRY